MLQDVDQADLKTEAGEAAGVAFIAQSQKSTYRPFLCTILQREGLLSRRQAEKALQLWRIRRQAGENVSFGDLLLQLGICTVAQLRFFTRLQQRLASAPGDRPLGHLLIENALLTPVQLLIALELQRSTKQPLGELLLQEGLLREPQLEVLLRFQKQQRLAV